MGIVLKQTMRKKFLLLTLSFLLGTGLFIWIVQSVGWQAIKEVFFVINTQQVLILFFLSLLVPLIEGVRWKGILELENKELSFKDSFKLGVSSFSINFLVPILFGSAEFFRGYFLKQKKNYSGLEITSSIIVDRIIGWTVDAIFVVLGVFLFFYNIRITPNDLLIKIGWFFLFFILCLLFFYFSALKNISIVKIFHKIFNNEIKGKSLEVEKRVFDFFRLPKKDIMKPFVLSFIKDLIMCFRVWLLVLFLGKTIPIISAISIVAFLYLAIIVPVPATLGSHEIIQIFAFNSLDMSSSMAIAFTMIDRGISFLVALIGIVFLFKIGGSFLKKYFVEKNNNSHYSNKHV